MRPRIIGAARRLLTVYTVRGDRPVLVQTPVAAPPPRRLPAMGIDVQPVHGHHCICGRCQPPRGTGHRHAA